MTLCGYPFRVGRSPELSLSLPVNGVSKVHAEIRHDKGELWLHDLESTNGTFVNGERISEPTRLEEGDVIQFSDQGFRLKCWASQPLSDTVQHSPLEQALQREMAERQRATESLYERELHWQTVLEMLNDGVVIFDSLGVIETANPAARALFGYGEGELQGQSIQELFAPEHREEFFPDWLNQQEPPMLVSEHCEFAGQHREGNTFPAQVSINEIELTNRKSYVAIFRNMTAYNEKEEELREAISRAESASESKSDFLARVSHDLRSPLTAIIGYVEILQTEGQNSDELDWQEALQIIARNGQQAMTLLNDLLDLAKMEAGILHLENGPCSPQEVIRQSIQLVRLQAGRQRVAAEPAVLPSAATADCDRLQPADADSHQPAHQRHQVHRRGQRAGRAGAVEERENAPVPGDRYRPGHDV